MRILITGGMGYLGGRFADDLSAHGHDITILSQDPLDKKDAQTRAWAKRYRVLVGDITSPESLARTFRDAGPIDAVIHAAAVNELVCARDPKLAMEVNAFGSRNTIEAAAAAGVRRFLYLSTFHVYGMQEGKITEATVPVPLHPYGITHLVAELLCRDVARRHGIELAILRPSNGIGAPVLRSVDRWSLLVMDLCRQAHETGALRLETAGHQRRDFVSIGDLCQAVRILLDAPASALADPVFNVSAGKTMRVREVAKTVQAEYEKAYRMALPLCVPDGEDTASTFSFPARKLAALGYRPTTDIAQEIRETLRICEAFRPQRSNPS